MFTLVLAAELREAKWVNNHMAQSISSPVCQKTAFVSSSGLVRPCYECASILKIKMFKVALKRPIPPPGKSKYTPNIYRDPITGEAFSRHKDVEELVNMVRPLSGDMSNSILTSSQKDNMWLTFAKRSASGAYKDFSALTGLLQVMKVTEDRRERGVGMQNMKYPEGFDRFCATLAAISPSAYRSFSNVFGGRSLESMR